MAASLTLMRSLVPSHLHLHYISASSAVGVLVCVRNNSNAASVTRAKRMVYPRTYPTLLVFPDGSTINIRYKEPRRIIKLPLDFSKLSEAERKKVLANRKPKQKLEVVEDFDDKLDLSEYSKFFKK